MHIYKAEHRECTTLSGLALASFCHAIGCLQMKLSIYQLQPMSAPHFSAVAMPVSVHDSHDARKDPSTVFSRRSTDQAGGNEAWVQPDYRAAPLPGLNMPKSRRRSQWAAGVSQLVADIVCDSTRSTSMTLMNLQWGGRRPSAPR